MHRIDEIEQMTLRDDKTLAQQQASQEHALATIKAKRLDTKREGKKEYLPHKKALASDGIVTESVIDDFDDPNFTTE